MPKPSVPAPVLQNMLRHHWGEIDDFHQLTEGLASQAFGFRAGDTEYVVRVVEVKESAGAHSGMRPIRPS